MAQADQGKEFFTQKNIFSSKSDRQRRQLLLNSILIYLLNAEIFMKKPVHTLLPSNRQRIGSLNSIQWLVNFMKRTVV